MRLINWRTARKIALLAVVALTPALVSAETMTIATEFGAGDEPTLADLENGMGYIVVGDKEFTDFVYTSQPGTPTSDQIVVEGFENAATGEIGLIFNVAFSAGITGPLTLDASLLFNVNILDPNYVFDSASMTATASISTLDENTGVAGIEETIVANPGGDAYGLLVENNVLEGVQGPAQLTDTVTFGEDTAYTSLAILKDIFVAAGEDEFDRARLTTFTQVFTQRPIPEPTTLCLMGLALCGSGAFSMRHRLG